LKLAQDGGRSPQAASAMHDLGCLARATGDFAGAESWSRQALDLYEATGDRASAALTRLNLADALRSQGDLGTARVLASKSLQEASTIENVRALGYAHQFLGDIARDEGNPDEARREYAACLEVTTAAGDVHATSQCLERVAWISGHEQPDRALAIMLCADTVRRSLWTPLEPVDQIAHDRAMAEAEARVTEAERGAAKQLAAEIDPRDAVSLSAHFADSVCVSPA